MLIPVARLDKALTSQNFDHICSMFPPSTSKNSWFTISSQSFEALKTKNNIIFKKCCKTEKINYGSDRFIPKKTLARSCQLCWCPLACASPCTFCPASCASMTLRRSSSVSCNKNRGRIHHERWGKVDDFGHPKRERIWRCFSLYCSHLTSR